MEYYSLDAILASAVRVPCTFACPVLGYAFLNGGHEGAAAPVDDPEGPRETQLPANTRVELPYWAIEALARRDEPALSVTMPKFLNEHVLNDMDADPQSVDLRRLCPWFFAFAAHFFRLIRNRDAEARAVTSTFLARLAVIMSYSQCGGHQTTKVVDFVQSLDETEQLLYRIGTESMAAKKRWLDRRVHRLTRAAASVSAASLHALSVSSGAPGAFGASRW